MRPVILIAFIAAALCSTACRRAEPTKPDHPRLAGDVELRDVVFHSAALNRDMTYRVILPKTITPGQKLPVVYLLHGNGGGFRDWSNYSDVAGYAAHGLILVMPEGGSSYYVNAVDRPGDRYEDYIIHDLIGDVEATLPAAAGREHRAIAGVSMGGFGAVVLSFRHPELFAFAAGLSPALDVPRRRFSFKRIGQWREHRAIFGPTDGPARRSEDPYVLARNADPKQLPYFFLTCGDREGLLPANSGFAAELRRQHIAFEFHEVAGAGHDWTQWNGRVPEMMQELSEYIH